MSKRPQSGSPDEPPAYFLALVMSVLAVTESPIGGAGGVYPRQNQLLGRTPEAKEPPGYSEHVPALWRAWNEWLDGPGSIYGTSTARTHEHWTYQGWARSQGLFRQGDRALVQDWFEDRGIEAGDKIPGMQLLQGFLSWLDYRGHAADALRTKVSDEATREVLADLLESELRAWVGVAGTDRGGRRIRGLVVYDSWGEVFSVAVPITRDIVGMEVSFGESETTLGSEGDLSVLPLTGRRTCAPECW